MIAALRYRAEQIAALGVAGLIRPASGQGLPFAPGLFDLHAWSLVCRIPDPTTAAATDGRSVPDSDLSKQFDSSDQAHER